MRVHSVNRRAPIFCLDFGERHEKKRFRRDLRARLSTTGNCRYSDEQDNGNFKMTEARFFAIEHLQSDRLLALLRTRPQYPENRSNFVLICIQNRSTSARYLHPNLTPTLTLSNSATGSHEP